MPSAASSALSPVGSVSLEVPLFQQHRRYCSKSFNVLRACQCVLILVVACQREKIGGYLRRQRLQRWQHCNKTSSGAELFFASQSMLRQRSDLINTPKPSRSASWTRLHQTPPDCHQSRRYESLPRLRLISAKSKNLTALAVRLRDLLPPMSSVPIAPLPSPRLHYCPRYPHLHLQSSLQKHSGAPLPSQGIRHDVPTSDVAL